MDAATIASTMSLVRDCLVRVATKDTSLGQHTLHIAMMNTAIGTLQTVLPPLQYERLLHFVRGFKSTGMSREEAAYHLEAFDKVVYPIAVPALPPAMASPDNFVDGLLTKAGPRSWESKATAVEELENVFRRMAVDPTSFRLMNADKTLTKSKIWWKINGGEPEQMSWDRRLKPTDGNTDYYLNQIQMSRDTFKDLLWVLSTGNCTGMLKSG